MRSGLILALVRVALMTALQYRASFLLEFFVGVGTTASVVLPLVFVFDHTASVAGWSLHASLLVAAFFLVLQAMVGGLVEPKYLPAKAATQ